MRKVFSYIAIGIFSLSVFQVKIGFERVAPENDDWLLIRTTDRITDYLVWRYFTRVELEDMPDTLNYSFPQRISPIYTNVTPLIGYPLKWSGIAKKDKFQFYGAWFLLCFLLQGIFALYFLYALGVKKEWSAFLGACFFVISVPLLFRLDHPTLMHHWSVIAGLIPFFKNWKPYFALIWYLTLSVIASTTHPYMLVFGLGIPIIYFFHRWVGKGRFKWVEAMIPVSAISASLTLLWSMGAFGFDVSTASSGGFGYYSANLNTFYNNLGYARAPLEFNTYHAGAYEGIAYLGVGLLLILAAIFITRRNEIRKHKRAFASKWIIFTLGVMAFAFFAFSDVWTFHNLILVSWPEFGLEKFFGIFRSSGRYIWLPFYLLMGLIILAWTSLPFDNKWIVGGLGIALLIQLWDLQPIIEDKIPENSGIEEFSRANWKEIMTPFDKIITYPPYQRTLYKPDDASHLIYLASFNAIPITAGHLPRPDEKAQHDLIKSLNKLLEGSPDPGSVENYRKTLFVTTMGYLPKFRPLIEKGLLKVRSVGDYMLLMHTETLERNAEVIDAYTSPVETTEITHLEDWLDQREEGSLIIVGQDEVSSHPGPGFIEWMEDKGSQFIQVRFRDAYYARIENGELREEKWDERAVQDTFFTGNDHWIIRSEGNKAGNDSYIIVNGEKFDQLSRGLNIFHISGKTDSMTYARFDTYISDGMQEEYKLLINKERN